MNVSPLLVANAQPPELIEPSEGPFYAHRHRPSPAAMLCVNEL
jgi:hypothetical protein